MSRKLPPQPSLEHLRKQAKELLKALQQHDRSAQLSDAQHAIAKQHGFASWPKLKAHIDSLFGPGAAAPQKTSPFVGRWVANLSKSRRHPANQFQSATIQIEVTGDAVTIDDVVVDASGREERSRNSLTADGIERKVGKGNGYAFSAGWRGTHILETVAKKDDRVVGWGTYEVSADGNTMTISADDQVIVLDRR